MNNESDDDDLSSSSNGSAAIPSRTHDNAAVEGQSLHPHASPKITSSQGVATNVINEKDEKRLASPRSASSSSSSDDQRGKHKRRRLDADQSNDDSHSSSDDQSEKDLDVKPQEVTSKLMHGQGGLQTAEMMKIEKSKELANKKSAEPPSQL